MIWSSIPVAGTGCSYLITGRAALESTITAAPAAAPLGSVRKHGERVTVVAKTRAGVIVAVLRSVLSDAAHALHVPAVSALRGLRHKVFDLTEAVKP